MIFNFIYTDSNGNEKPVIVDNQEKMPVIELSDLGFIQLRTFDKETGCWIKFTIAKVQDIENKSLRYAGQQS